MQTDTSRKHKVGSRRLSLWFFIAFFYVIAQAALYAQDHAEIPSPNSVPSTPWEHISLEGALALAVGVQYRENRAKEIAATKLSIDAATAIARATEIMENVTEALERLAGKIEQCPARLYQPRTKG